MKESYYSVLIESLVRLCRNRKNVSQSESAIKGKLVDQVIIFQSE